MAMMGDGQTAYDQDHDGKANELAGCSVRFSYNSLE
jgi:mannose-binding lectin 2